MKCPNDSATLVMSERSGVEIDYCPECRGVWLDRGELDKILDRAASESPAAAAPSAPTAAAPPAQQYPPAAPQYQQPAQARYDESSYNRSYGDRGYGYGGRPKKKESWLSELFD